MVVHPCYVKIIVIFIRYTSCNQRFFELKFSFAFISKHLSKIFTPPLPLLFIDFLMLHIWRGNFDDPAFNGFNSLSDTLHYYLPRNMDEYLCHCFPNDADCGLGSGGGEVADEGACM